MRLYRHALESIFALLTLQDLTQILRVSRSWSAAVRSTTPAGATITRNESLLKSQGKAFCPLPPISSLVAGPLLRHLTGIQIAAARTGRDIATPLTSESLALLAQHAPHLKSLWCELTLTPAPAPLIWPASLTSLQLRVSAKPSTCEINRMLTTLAALPSLQHLLLHNRAADADLTLLAASRSLRDLTLSEFWGLFCHPSDGLLAQLRSSLGHLQRIDLGQLDSAMLARLLQQPHDARWQDIGTVLADADSGDSIAALPALTKVNLHYAGLAPHADFLSQMPLLTTLKLDCKFSVVGPRTWGIPAAPLLASLLPCTGLTELDLNCGFNSTQACSLLEALTKLRKLTLQAELESLRCFASGPVTQTLETLHLVQPALLPASEAVHLHALKYVQSIFFEGVFKSLKGGLPSGLSPPSTILPRLTRCVCYCARF